MKKPNDTPAINVPQTWQQLVFDQIKIHGLPLLLVCMAVWYLHGRQEMVEKKVEGCNAHVIQILTEDREALIEVIRSNTAALQGHNEDHE